MGNKGSILLYIVLLLSLLLTVVFGLSALISSQFEIMKSNANSIIAFYAADAGVERMLNSVIALNEDLPNPDANGDVKFSGNLNNNASYEVYIYCKSNGNIASCGTIPKDSDCSADNYCVKSIGNYKNAKRAIMVMI